MPQVSIHRDVLQELRDSQARAQSIFETAVDGIVTIDARGIVESLNPAAVSLFGYPAEEVLGKNVSMLMAAPHAAAHDGYIDRYLKTGVGSIIGVGREVQGRRKDGGTFPLHLSVSQWSLSGKVMFTGICHDLTELKRHAARLATSAKLASLGELCGRIAHEINNPISIISGKARLRLSDPNEELPKKTERDLKKIVEQCYRIADLTRSLLDYCRPNSSPKGALDLQAPLNRSLDFVAEKAERHGVKIERHLPDSLPLALANHSEMEQVFLNLCLNAIDAMSAKHDMDGGSLTVTAGAGDKVWIAIQDTGPGVPQEVEGRIFEPFFTTKGDRGGTGLGLAVSYGILCDHSGELRLEAGPDGVGALFRVLLPRA